MTTPFINPQTASHQWYVVDAANQVLGRLAVEIANHLRGKHKPQYTPHADTGDYIIVINADKVRVTGNKAEQKIYYRHTGYVGNLKQISFEKLIVKNPCRILEEAVRGMLPKGPLARDMYRKLWVYAGSTHPHSAQQPASLTFKIKGT